MRILMCLADAFFPPDVRVEKEARTLLKGGHEVFLVCPKREGEPREEEVKGVKVYRIDRLSGFLRRVWHFWMFTFFHISPLWGEHLARIVEQQEIEALHIHDLPAVGTGLSVARRFGIPLVADLHEDYPGYIQIHPSNRTWRGRLLNRIRRWEHVERFCIQKADRVITVTEEAKEHHVVDCGISPEKVTVVGNTTDLDYFYSRPIEEEITKRYESFFTILYVGGVRPHRGIDTAIEAMPEILQAIPNAKLVLVGPSPIEAELKELVSRKQVEEAVEFTGWQPFDLVPSYIAASMVCLHTYIETASPQSKASSPNKLFDYMAMGKPVIVASSQEVVKRLVTEAKTGLVYSAGDAHSLAEAVIELYRDSDLARRLGEAGREVVREKYNWAIDAEKLLALYQDLC